jgi:hypothetical protein
MVGAGLLLILFLLPPFAKSFHISLEQTIIPESNEQSRHHDSDDCPICQFHFTSFVGTEFLELNIVSSGYSLEPFFYDAKECYSPLFSYFLRGPPGN